jgi:hypothetical protein
MFPFKRKINININNENIKINSPFVDLYMSIENNENYYSIIELLER